MSERLSPEMRAALRGTAQPITMLWLYGPKGQRVFSLEPLPEGVIEGSGGVPFDAAVSFDADVYFDGGVSFPSAEARLSQVASIKGGTALRPENLLGAFQLSGRRGLRAVLKNDDRGITSIMGGEPLIGSRCDVVVGYQGLSAVELATLLKAKVEAVELRGRAEASLSLKEI